MPNLNYTRSRSREYKVLHEYQAQGWLCFRTAGSHGVADVVCIKMTDCGNPSHFEVKLLQIKVSIKYKRFQHTPSATDTPIGLVNIDYLRYPVVNRKKKVVKKLSTERKVKKK